MTTETEDDLRNILEAKENEIQRIMAISIDLRRRLNEAENRPWLSLDRCLMLHFWGVFLFAPFVAAGLFYFTMRDIYALSWIQSSWVAMLGYLVSVGGLGKWFQQHNG